MEGSAESAAMGAPVEHLRAAGLAAKEPTPEEPPAEARAEAPQERVVYIVMRERDPFARQLVESFAWLGVFLVLSWIARRVLSRYDEASDVE